jgi:hypothetical protein
MPEVDAGMADALKGTNGADALERLKEREEILQIGYWYQGEGLGTVLTPQAVLPFLQAQSKRLADTFEALVESGDLFHCGNGYDFTPAGKRKAARMFAETFTDFQQPGHGECVDGCCDGDEPCETHAGHGHVHAHVPTHAHG